MPAYTIPLAGYTSILCRKKGVRSLAYADSVSSYGIVSYRLVGHLHSTVLWDWFQDWHSPEGLSMPPLILGAFYSTWNRDVRRLPELFVPA